MLAEEKPLPQLIFIDGGKGQISAAAAAMQSLDLEAIPIVGLVKPPKHHNQISHLLRFGYEENPVPFDASQTVFPLGSVRFLMVAIPCLTIECVKGAQIRAS